MTTPACFWMNLTIKSPRPAPRYKKAAIITDETFASSSFESGEFSAYSAAASIAIKIAVFSFAFTLYHFQDKADLHRFPFTI